jgi:hypothetical protein
MLGLYHDVNLRESSGWLFTRRRQEVIYQGPADLSGPPWHVEFRVTIAVPIRREK